MRLSALDCQHRCRARLLMIRAMYRILESAKFEQAAEKATDKQLERLEVILKSDSITDLKNWIRDTIDLPLVLRPLRELQELARQKMIPKYSRMTKGQLVRALEKQ